MLVNPKNFHVRLGKPCKYNDNKDFLIQSAMPPHPVRALLQKEDMGIADFIH